jgi:hypothetical protein
MRWLSPVLAVAITFTLAPGIDAQEAGFKLNIVIVEGDGALNNIRLRTAREPIVEVQDENHKPVAGAAVVFALADQGATGSFAGGVHTLTVVTDNQGRAIARGFHPNNVQGQYQIHVTASKNGQTATSNISETNVAGAAAASSAAKHGGSGKVIAIIAVVAAAAAGGIYAGTHTGGGGSNSASSSAITIQPGTGVVGPPK